MTEKRESWLYFNLLISLTIICESVHEHFTSTVEYLILIAVFCTLVIMWLLTRVNETRLPRGKSLTLPSHLLVGSPISLFRLIISGNRETTPIYLSGYLWFIANCFVWRNLLITSARFTSSCQSTHLLWWKTAAKSSRGRGAKETKKLFLGVEGGRGKERRTLPPVPRVLSFFSSLKFCKF